MSTIPFIKTFWKELVARGLNLKQWHSAIWSLYSQIYFWPMNTTYHLSNGGRYSPPYKPFRGRNNMSRAATPQRDRDFLDPPENLWPPCLISKKPLPLHSWRPLLHKSHIECISSPRSKIQYIYVHFHWVNKQLIGISFLKWNWQ